MNRIVFTLICHAVILLHFSVTSRPAQLLAPTKGTTMYCFELTCVSDTIAMLKDYDPIFLGIISYDFERDSYLALYLGTILELFDIPGHNVVALVLQNPVDTPIFQTVFQFIQLLPPKSVFVSIEHGRSGAGLKSLRVFQQHGVCPKVIYHLNHEQPWEVDEKDLNHIFDSVQELADFYSTFDLVIRNYYYTPLLSASHYVPTGAPFDGYIIGNATSELFQRAQITKASQRERLCYFKGRISYAKYQFEENTSPVIDRNSPHPPLPKLLKSDDMFPQAMERKEIIRLAAEGKLGGCTAHSSDESTFKSYARDSNVDSTGSAAGESSNDVVGSYDTFVANVANAAFVLCPAGNNPETFRHYEVRVRGSVDKIFYLSL
jgi:hypothetical protein